jgi:thiamine kinase
MVTTLPTTALPRPIQLKLDHTLAQWRQWRCAPSLRQAPVSVGIMAPGLSNISVLVEAESDGGPRRFVVRLDGANPALNSVNRQSEWRVLRGAHRAGLAPQPLYFNPDLGSLVCAYLPPDTDQSLCVDELATLLRQVHRLPAIHHRLDLSERILGYEKQLQHRADTAAGASVDTLAAVLAPWRDRLTELLTAIRTSAEPTVLCHNDLLQANRIYSGEHLWALDWEYCAMGSRWFELAVIVAGDELGADTGTALLESYLDRPAMEQDLRQLQLHSCVYRYLELLWYLTAEHQGLAENVWQDKLGRLQHAFEALRAVSP